jgi:hypothetical protein
LAREADMTEVPRLLETFATFVARLEEYVPEIDKHDILISRDIDVTPLREGNGITKMPVIWPLIDYKMFYITTVPPKTKVAKHSHIENVFRLVISGSLVVNDKPVGAGEWFVVRRNVPYEIYTESGYQVLSGYGQACQTGGGDAASPNKGVTISSP